MASTDAKPFPLKNTAYRITFPILDADGDLVTAAAGLDSEISKDGGTFADCTNEATEIATSSGMYYIDLTATEMNADTVAIIIKTSTSGAKTTPIVIYPVENTDIPVNVKAIGDTVQSATDLKDFADAGYDPSAHRTQAQVKGMDDGIITAAKIATDAITATKIAADAIGSSEFAQAAADKVWATAARALTDKAGFALSSAAITAIFNKDISAYSGAGYAGTYLKTVYDDWLNGGRLDLILDDILLDTGTTLDALIKDVPTVAEFEARSILAADYVVVSDTIAGVTAVSNDVGITQAGADKVWGTAARALTDKTGFGLSTAGILAIWHQLTANIVTADTIGKLLKDDINTTISSRSSHNAAAIWSAGSRELSTPANYKADVSLLALEATLTAMKGATFVEATDSLEAIRDRGDAAWLTGAGGSDRLLMVDTTIATLASQTSFTLTAGSADDGAYNNCTIVIEDASAPTQKAMGLVSNYVGATKTITLKYDPAIFSMAITDKVYILAENALKSTLANRQLNVAADGDIAGNIDGSVASVVGHTAQTGDSFARLGAPAAASIAADLLAIDNFVDELESRLSATRAGYLDNINNANLATIANISTLTATEIAHLNANISSRSSHAAADIWSVGTRALTDKVGFALSTAGILAIWHQLTANIVTANTIGKLLKDDINATISSRSSHNAAAVWSAGSRALSTPNDYKADVSSLALEATLTAMKGATYAEATDSLEAIRDRGDVAWVTGAGSDATEAKQDSIIAYVDEIETRLSAARAGYLDNLSVGAVALEATLTAIKGSGWTDETLKAIKDVIDTIGGEVGPGALSCTWTQKDDEENPMDNVQIWISTDEAGNNVIAGTLITDANGEVTFMLDEGTYYVWRERAGYNFINPQTWSVS